MAGAVRLLIICAISGTLAYWAFDRATPVTRVAFGIEDPAVAPGGKIDLLMHVHRARSCRGRIERIVIDANNYRFVIDDVDFGASPGPLGEDRYMIRIPVSSGAARGPAKLRTILTYECNPLHRIWPITDRWELPFEIH